MAINSALLGQTVYLDGIASTVTAITGERLSVLCGGRRFTVPKSSSRLSNCNYVHQEARNLSVANFNKRRKQELAEIAETFQELASSVRGGIDPLVLPDVLRLIEAKKRFEMSRI